MEEPGAKQIIPLLESETGSDMPLLPPEFIDRLVERFNEDGLREIFEPIFEELAAKMLETFIMGSFIPPLRALAVLFKNKTLISLVTLIH